MARTSRFKGRTKKRRSRHVRRFRRRFTRRGRGGKRMRLGSVTVHRFRDRNPGAWMFVSSNTLPLIWPAGRTNIQNIAQNTIDQAYYFSARGTDSNLLNGILNSGYNWWRLDKVAVKFTPNTTQLISQPTQTTPSNAGINYGYELAILHAKDMDPGILPDLREASTKTIPAAANSWAQLADFSKTKLRKMYGKPFIISYKPALYTAIYTAFNIGTGSSFAGQQAVGKLIYKQKMPTSSYAGASMTPPSFVGFFLMVPGATILAAAGNPSWNLRSTISFTCWEPV